MQSLGGGVAFVIHHGSESPEVADIDEGLWRVVDALAIDARYLWGAADDDAALLGCWQALVRQHPAEEYRPRLLTVRASGGGEDAFGLLIGLPRNAPLGLQATVRKGAHLFLGGGATVSVSLALRDEVASACRLWTIYCRKETI